jgi:hypothetical protein
LNLSPVIRAAAILMLLAGWASAAQPVGSPLEASTSPEARQDALASIPYTQLDAQARAKCNNVLANVTLFRRLPVRVIECDPQLYLLLVRHPDVVANIWEVLGVSQIRVRQVSPGNFSVIDIAGTRGTLEVLYASDELNVAYGEGSYEGPLSVRPARGSFLLILRSGYLRDTEGRCYITSRLDCFINIEPGATEFVTKVLQPVVGKIADMNFVQSVGFLGSLSRTAELNHRGVQRLSTKLKYVRPETREELAGMAERIGTQHQAESEASASEPAVNVGRR